MANTQRSGSATKPSRPGSKRIVKWGAGLLAGFLAFAPPGTMVVIVLLISRFFGISWALTVGIVLVAIAVTVFILLRRRKSEKDAEL